jgi:hypothetical protein
VSNVAVLPVDPESVLATYRSALGRHARDESAFIGDWDETVDLTWIVGLLLRGWRKGRDTATGITLASGVPATEDLEVWCRRAVEAAGRRL